MCGIAGLYRRDGAPIETAILRATIRALAHRGPDGEHMFEAPGIGLGHRRLAIRDLSDGGRQPMLSPCGQVATIFNGEIYNDTELRRNLEITFGARFRTTCDAEILPQAWLAWGEALFERLEGMFAVAVWDARTHALTLARDGVGIKPLFYSDDGAIVRFGSEIKALLADPEQPRRIDAASLHAFFAQGYVGPTGTYLDGVRQLAPGTVAVFDAAGRRERRFWTPRRQPRVTRLEEALEGFDALWPEVVGEMLTASDVPVGVLQSGGIDSSLVTSCLADRRDTPLFVAEFAETSHDETSLAAAVARSAGLPLRRVRVSEPEDAAAVFAAVVRGFDGQVADSSAFAAYLLMQAVRRELKVALSGDGADEFFGGYPTYRASRVARLTRSFVPRALVAALGRRALAADLGEGSRVAHTQVLGRFFTGVAQARVAPHAHWRRLLPAEAIAPLYGPELRPVAANNPLQDYENAFRDAEGGFVDRCLLADQRHYLPADMLMKVDAMSMAHGLEIRVPFLDRRIMELAGALDVRLLTPFAGPDKRILRAALERRGGPPNVVAGAKKGFNVPIAGLLRTRLRGMGDRLLDREADRLAPYLASDEIRRIWRSHLARQANHSYVLWTILTFAVYLASLETSPTS